MCSARAGSRIGWAIVGDESTAELMSGHVARASGYVQENQLRATLLLQHVLGDHGGSCCLMSSSSSSFTPALVTTIFNVSVPLVMTAGFC